MLAPRARSAFRIDSYAAEAATVRAGLGIGAMQAPIGPADADLVPVLPDLLIHSFDTWIVAHEDLRHTPRIAADSRTSARRL